MEKVYEEFVKAYKQIEMDFIQIQFLKDDVEDFNHIPWFNPDITLLKMQIEYRKNRIARLRLLLSILYYTYLLLILVYLCSHNSKLLSYGGK